MRGFELKKLTDAEVVAVLRKEVAMLQAGKEVLQTKLKNVKKVALDHAEQTYRLEEALRELASMEETVSEASPTVDGGGVLVHIFNGKAHLPDGSTVDLKQIQDYMAGCFENTGYKPYAETAHQLSKLTGIPWSTAATI